MSREEWYKEMPVAVTVCDVDGNILTMNDKAGEVFQKDGGKNLIGKNVLDCHPEAARTKLKGLLDSQTANCYTIEKNGVKKLVYQTPWYNDGQYMGLVELLLEIPSEIPHFKR